MACQYCSTINRLCFWGPRPEAGWKRPVLLLCSVAIVAGCSWVLWQFGSRPDAFLLLILSACIAGVGGLGILVCIHGCNACVARLFGEV